MYKDNDDAFDYIAMVLDFSVINSVTTNPRLSLAISCMEAYFLEGGETSLKETRPYAARIIEQLAIRLMGTDWTKAWLKNFREDPVSFERAIKPSDDLGGEIEPKKIADKWIGRCFKWTTRGGHITFYYQINCFENLYSGLLIQHDHKDNAVFLYPSAGFNRFWLIEDSQELSQLEFNKEIKPLFNRINRQWSNDD